MPGLASADPHTVTTLSIIRMNGTARGGPNAASAKTDECTTVAEPSASDRLEEGLEPVLQGDSKEAEESLSHYCKPVELYNIIQRRAVRNPLFLQRCLSYKLEAARQRRIKMTVSVLGCIDDSGELGSSTPKVNFRSLMHIDYGEQQFWPVFVMVTSPVAGLGSGQSVYRLNQTRLVRTTLTSSSCNGSGEDGMPFILPELRKLFLSAKKDGHVVLFILFADPSAVYKDREYQSQPLEKCSGHVFWGKLMMTTLCNDWISNSRSGASTAGLNGNRVDIVCDIDLYHGNLQHENFADGQGVKLQPLSKSSTSRSLVQLQVYITGEEVEEKLIEAGQVHNGTHTMSTIPPSARRPRYGRVIFHYLYHFNTLRKTEVTEDFSCPFCLVHCSSFKGLHIHLNASHDLFNFEYLDSDGFQVVNVRCRNDLLGHEGGQGDDSDLDGFSDSRIRNFVYKSRCGVSRRILASTAKEPIDQEVSTSQLRGYQGKVIVKPCQTHGLPSMDGRGIKESREDSNFVLKDALRRNLDSTGVCVREKSCEQQAWRTIDMLEADVGRPCARTAFLLQSPDVKPHETFDESSKTLEGLRQREDLKTRFENDQTANAMVFADMDHAFPPQKKLRSDALLFDQEHVSTSAFGGFPSMIKNGLCASAAVAVVSSDECLAMPLVAPRIEKSRKVSTKRAEARSRALLQKRQFFHSHTAQPMALEQLLSDKDSEDEIDDFVANFEDRRMLDDFVDVTKHEKEVMHLWNAFVRKQRVLADGHCAWACEAFSKLHAQIFQKDSTMRRCLMLFLIKLWNHHLIDGKTVDRCLTIVES